MPVFYLRDARSDFHGYSTLAWLHEFARKAPSGEIVLDCSRLRWLDANLSAPLSAVMHASLGPSNRTYRFAQLSRSLASLLCDNGLVQGERSARGTVIWIGVEN
ncbi:hypothetical protein [Phenylobacterium sp.]|uniref:hypothetical protein n=1 Tax=Phenylobacterium sp. TaxID=1871053 RepID=UPI0017F86390|nr:hypothetical protein [Phenylobacterium sp.]MBA4793288.1 hypothetical protein [Phenylobacterium sp.]